MSCETELQCKMEFIYSLTVDCRHNTLHITRFNLPQKSRKHRWDSKQVTEAAASEIRKGSSPNPVMTSISRHRHSPGRIISCS